MNLVEDNINLAHFVAHEYKHIGIEYEDLVSIATIGLVKAANTYDESMGYKFSTYAIKCARTEMLKQLRKIKKRAVTISFEQTTRANKEDCKIGDTIEDENDWVGKFVEHEDLTYAMSKLTDKEKTVIELRYYKNLTRNEVAEKMGMSNTLCSSITKRALSKLRKSMAT